jgi:hypothetical protein
MSRSSLLFLAFAACGGDDSSATVTLADLGQACDASHPCSGGAECGTCGIGTGQCVSACDATGTTGCPTGSFCSEAWSGSSTHICVRLCDADVDCQTPTGNTGLSCNDPYLDPGTKADDTSICNVSNSIGSANTCPGD